MQKPKHKNLKRTIISSVIMRRLSDFDSLKNTKLPNGLGCLDKLHIHSPSLDVSYIQKKFVEKSLDIKRKEIHYQEGKRFLDKRTMRTFYVFKDPYFKNVEHPYFIQINPSHFSGLRELSIFIEKIIGRKGWENHKISRLDISVKLPKHLFPISLFRASTYFRWKRTMLEHSSTYSDGHISGYYSGPSRTLRFSIYDVDVKNVQRYGEITTFNQTNFEIQCHSGYLRKNNIIKVKDLYKIGASGVFKRVSFYDTFEHRHSLDEREVRKFQNIQEELFETGFHNARIRLNKETKRNFIRNYKYTLGIFRIGSQRIPLRAHLARSFRHSFEEWCSK